MQQQAQNRVAAPRDPTTAYGLDTATLQITSQLDTRIRLIDATGVVVADSPAPDAGRDLAEIRW